MAEATLTSKGQVTIPKVVRDSLGLREGDRVDFVETDQGVLLVPATKDVKALRGMFKGRRKRPATVGQIKAAIGEMGSDS
jgi:AbrB family looped-hinge helix DNA binding protein